MSPVEVLLPLGVAILGVGLGPVAYLAHARLSYGKAKKSLERQLDPEQVERLKHHPGAAELQLATNRVHNRAIEAKKRYHMTGIAASSVGPLLIALAGCSELFLGRAMITIESIHLLEVILIAALLVLVFMNSKPADTFCRTRLQAELLRLHLHAYLAGVGPYDGVAITPIDANLLAERVDSMDLELVYEELRTFADTCLFQSQGSFAGAPAVTEDTIDTYVIERVSEEAAFFNEAGERQERAYSRSAKLLGALLGLGLVAAVARLFGNEDHAVVTRLLMTTASAAGALILGLRAVFGWDSHAELYYRQRARLHKVGVALLEIRQRAASGVGLAEAIAFRQNAAMYESLMGREGCDWAMITDRRFYDASM